MTMLEILQKVAAAPDKTIVIPASETPKLAAGVTQTAGFYRIVGNEDGGANWHWQPTDAA
ncbi:MAG: hypothetical protein JWQ87_2234 [Candidatus Sulfotelmatobacter sp.]|nr:hypothetical protein [Candidatus Sulfotelmatobacter sp.]